LSRYKDEEDTRAQQFAKRYRIDCEKIERAETALALGNPSYLDIKFVKSDAKIWEETLMIESLVSKDIDTRIIKLLGATLFEEDEAQDWIEVLDRKVVERIACFQSGNAGDTLNVSVVKAYLRDLENLLEEETRSSHAHKEQDRGDPDTGSERGSSRENSDPHTALADDVRNINLEPRQVKDEDVMSEHGFQVKSEVLRMQPAERGAWVRRIMALARDPPGAATGTDFEMEAVKVKEEEGSTIDKIREQRARFRESIERESSVLRQREQLRPPSPKLKAERDENLRTSVGFGTPSHPGFRELIDGQTSILHQRDQLRQPGATPQPMVEQEEVHADFFWFGNPNGQRGGVLGQPIPVIPLSVSISLVLLARFLNLSQDTLPRRRQQPRAHSPQPNPLPRPP